MDQQNVLWSPFPVLCHFVRVHEHFTVIFFIAFTILVAAENAHTCRFGGSIAYLNAMEIASPIDYRFVRHDQYNEDGCRK
jgi:hypothetical protein